MNKRKYIMFTMIIISALSILEWGISFSPIFLIVSMALVYIVFPMKDLCSKSKYLKTIYNIYKAIINYICIFIYIIRRIDIFKYK